MNNESLSPELITNPSLWRLALEVRPHTLEVVIVSLLQDNSLIHRSIPLNPESEAASAVSEAIYANPLVLSDFGRIDILIDTPRRMMVPADVRSEDVRHDIMAVLWGDSQYNVLADEIAHSDDQMLMGVDTPLLSLLRRTFPIARISHRLSPIVRYFYAKDRLNSASKMYVHLLADSVDIVFIKNGKLAVVNTYTTPTTADVLYYILAVAKMADLDMEGDEIMICGLPEVRERVMPELRKYASRVMPVLFPSSLLSMGKEALTTPFELIILPLCE